MIIRFAKKILGKNLVHRLKSIKASASIASLRIVSRHRSLSSLYYALVSPGFAREHQAVMLGRLKFIDAQKAPMGGEYLLRRNVHRLEKGILMRPRRDVFALDYIAETVESYNFAKEALGEGSGRLEEVKWASDVLSEYFSVVASHAVVDSSRVAFQPIDQPDHSRPYVPYRRSLEGPVPVDFDALLQLARRRRSVRWYLQKAVPRELIDQAITLASLSPSACNRQPFEFRVFDDPALVRKIASIPGGTAGFRDNIPVIVVLVGKLSAYFSERDRHVIYVDGALAAMSFMFALESLGLSSCAINWPDVESMELKMAEAIGLSIDERPIMLMSLGYPDPDGMVAYSQKKSLNEIRRFN